jgi:hypothetical protein
MWSFVLAVAYDLLLGFLLILLKKIITLSVRRCQVDFTRLVSKCMGTTLRGSTEPFLV